MIPFRYFEFYDVPRCIVLRHCGKYVLLSCAFDDETDEYPDTYSVYELPESAEKLIDKGSWTFMEQNDHKFLGEIPVSSVHFDSSRRKTLDSFVRGKLITR